MRSFNSSELLKVWEKGLALTPFERGQLLGRIAHDNSDGPSFDRLSMGWREVLLINVRQRLFGSDIVGLARCPACNGQAELSFSLTELPLSQPPDHVECLSVSSNGSSVRFRLPTVEDVSSTLEQMDGTNARRYLLSRCIIGAEQDGREIDAENLPWIVLEEVERKMSEADPAAAMYLSPSCPSCSHRWDVAFDIAPFLWQDLHAWAVRLLRDVHQLASAYGWHESDILTLSAPRRSFYLHLINT